MEFIDLLLGDWWLWLSFLAFIWAPKTWTPGELVSAASMNTNIRDHLNESLRTQATTLTAVQNNFALEGPFAYLQCNNAADLHLTGFLVDGGNVDGARVIIEVLSEKVTLYNQSANSATSNRIITPDAANLVLAAFGRALLIYDGTASRWRVSRMSFSEIWELSGYVGIGQASPSAKLDVVINESGVYAGRFFNDTNANSHGLLVESDGTGVGSIAFFVKTDRASTQHVALKILGDGKIGIGAGPTGSTQLAIASTTGAFLLPRMTTAQRNALTPLNGMQIYNTTNGRTEHRENGSWVYHASTPA